MNSEQRYLNLYFQVHQPRRLKRFHFLDIGSEKNYFDDALNGELVRRIARECYLPANTLLLKLIDRHPAFRITFSISGTALEQFERYAPDALDSFRQLAETGAVEFLGETYYHSLAYFISHEEFIEQVGRHREKLNELLGVDPRVFRNTELIYSDGIGRTVSRLGFSGMYIDGIADVLRHQSCNALYHHPEEDLVLIPRNFQLSDDIAFRYSDETWSEWPLTASKFTDWISGLGPDENFVSLGLDYETFGEHKKSSSGIFAFLEQFVDKVFERSELSFVTPTEAIRLLKSERVASSERAVSWADEARDLSAWLGNDMQRDAFHSLYRFHDFITSYGSTELLETYRHLQTSDHFYYMSTKKGADGLVHQYFSPYASPYEAFMNYMNVIADVELRLKRQIERLPTPLKLTYVTQR